MIEPLLSQGRAMEIDVVNLVGLNFVKIWFLLALTGFLLSRSRNTSAATLHALLLLTLLGTAIMPLLASRIPGLYLIVLPHDFNSDLYWSYHQDAASCVFTLIGTGYLLCVIFLWLRRLLHIRQAFAVAKKARPLDICGHQKLLGELSNKLSIKRRVHLRYSDDISSPFTLGFFRPWILLPRESLLWDEHRLRRFFLHELAHIARCDWFTKQCTYCVAAAFWILPSAWKRLKDVEWLAEIACDDIVISAEGRRSDYAHDLLDMTSAQTLAGAIGLTETHNHYQRISAVLDGGRIRNKSPLKFWLHALAFLLVLFCVASLQLAQKPQPTESEQHLLQPLVIVGAVNDPQELDEETKEKELLGEWAIFDVAPPDNEPAYVLSGKDFAVAPTATALERIWHAAADDIKLDLVQPLVKMPPQYPSKALRRAREGVVELSFSVLPDGSTSQIEIIRAEPPGLFDKAAIEAVKQYRYTPRGNSIHGLNEIFEFRLIEDAN